MSDASTPVPDEPTPVPRWFTTARLPGPLDSPTPAVHVDVEFGARSRKGPQRFGNEDHYLVLRLGRHQETLLTSLPNHSMPQRFDEFAYGMMVADGMGPNGETASRVAITTLTHLMVYFGKWNLRIDEPIAEEIMDRAERFYRGVDSALVQAGRSGHLGLESTLTAAASAGNELFFAHVGHSRVYLCRDGQLLRLTHDHTFEPDGTPNVDEPAPSRDMHHGLTNAIGKPSTGGPRIDVERVGLLDGDTVLVCTNGLTDSIDEDRIAAVLGRGGSADDHSRTLVDLAIAAGGQDDVTALVARYRIPA